MKIENSIYFIVTKSMNVMGGAELYAIRRAKYLEETYNCKVIFLLQESVEEKSFWKKELEAFNVIITEEMRNPILFYSKKYISNITNNFLNEVNKKNIFFETHTIHLSIWAELFAQKLKGLNVLYFLNDSSVKNKYGFYPTLSFFNYKLENKEMIGLSKTLLSRIFKKNIEKEYNQYVNIAFSENELPLNSIFSKSKFNIKYKKKYDLVIGTVARLEKIYIRFMVEEVIKFSKEHKEAKICLLIGGDTPNKSVQGFYDDMYFKNSKFKKMTSNLEIIHLGYIHPLGKDFFSSLDVFIGQGTAVINSISQRKSTIVMEDRKLTNGFFGLDTDLFAYSNKPGTHDLKDLLKKILKDRTYLKRTEVSGYNLFLNEYEEKACFKKFDNYISLIEAPSSYKIQFKQRFRDFSLYFLLKQYRDLRTKLDKK